MSRRRRAIVVAIDGLGIDLLRSAIAAGTVPTLSKVAGPGGPRPVAARPPASPQAAWTTFTTASNPGRHGIFGLTHPGRQLRIRVASADHVRMPTLWDRAATDGLRSVVIGLPGTFPARRISGSLVAGYVVSNPERLCHPHGLRARLDRSGYRADVDIRLAETDPGRFGDELLASTKARVEVMRSLLAPNRWALGLLAFTELERWGHAMRRRAAAGERQARDLAAAMLGEIDAFVAWLKSAYPDARMLVLSAHGIAPVDRTLNLDAWLSEAGHLDRDAAGGLGDATVAFSMESGRIYIHAARMFAAGRLGGGSVLPLMDEIAEGLTRLRSATGAAPLEAVLRRRELYEGPHARVGPHLVAVPAAGWSIISSRGRSLETEPDPMEGAHRHDLAFSLGDLAGADRPATLEDLGATVLAHLGLYADDVDGRPVPD